MARFRPNIVMYRTTPWQEDELGDFRLGTVKLHTVKQDDRCKMTTIDPETAYVGIEPLRTLQSFRSHADPKSGYGLAARGLRCSTTTQC
eukprot:m.59131 g.59131  ORF g.59131 m.59131 type:complete len:89 (-) comp7193_c0_seq3:38-304(-)